MQTDLRESVTLARRLSAKGDFGAARHCLDDALEGMDRDKRSPYVRQVLTLEVLESLDLIRRLLKQSDPDGALTAADTMLEALSRDEYARLGIAGAALALLERGVELANLARVGAGGPRLKEEIAAYVEHLGRELRALERETVQRGFGAIEGTAQAASTLGELMQRKPFRSGISRPVGAAPPPEPQPEAEPERKPAPPAPDAFEIASRAALEHWHVVMFGALVFAVFGYFGVISTPDRYESSALLQRQQASRLRAPITNRPQTYVAELPARTAVRLTQLQAFHDRVAHSLQQGWAAPDETEPRRFSLTPQDVAAALNVRADEAESANYMLTLKAVHRDPAVARAIAGAAAEELRAVARERVVTGATAFLADYERRLAEAEQDLQALANRRLEEFRTDNVTAIGKTLNERTDSLIRRIEATRGELATAGGELAAARLNLENQESIAQRLPEFETPERDARIDERVRSLTALERDLRGLKRRAEPFGPEHPDRKRIREMEEEIELLQAEIRALEENVREASGSPPLHRERAWAEARVSEAQSRVTLLEARIKELEQALPVLQQELDSARAGLLESEALREQESRLRERVADDGVVITELRSVIDSADRELELVAADARPKLVAKHALLGIGVGAVLGLLVGLGAAIGLYRRQQARLAT